MWKKIALATVLSTTLIGSGGAALAASSSGSTPAPTPTTASGVPSPPNSNATTPNARHHHHDRLTHALHAQWVTHDKKTNADVTHDEIKGTVTAVSTTSITVKASDGVTQTYTVASGTTVHAKGDTKAAPGTIGQVKTGDQAIVIGTGTSTLAAAHVIDHAVAASTPRPTS